MYQTSAAYNEMIGRETRTFLARITFDDESVIDNGIRQATIVSGSCGSEMFTVGAAFSGYANLTIIDPEIDLTDQEFLLEIGLVLDDESVEYVPKGIYSASVADISRTKHSVTLTAWDRLARAGSQAYTPTVIYPCTAGDVLDDITNQTGLVFDLTAYPGIRDMEGFSAPEGTLISTVIGNIAGQKGGFAYADHNGNVVLAPYGETACEQISANRCLDEIFLSDNPVTMDAGGEIMEYEYYPGVVRFMGDPRLEPIDLIEIEDADEVIRQIPCMNIILTFDGGTTTTVQAPAQAQSDVNWGPVWNAISQTQGMAEEAETAANNAVAIATSKNKIFYSDTAPVSGMSADDLWFDTDGGNAIYQYTETGWVLKQFGTGSIMAGSVTANELAAASITADKLNANALTAIRALITTLIPDIIQSNDYQYTVIPYVYPLTTLYPAEDLYPSNGAATVEGFAIDFRTGEIRGAFYSSQIAALTSRIEDLENSLTYPKDIVSLNSMALTYPRASLDPELLLDNALEDAVDLIIPADTTTTGGDTNVI